MNHIQAAVFYVWGNFLDVSYFINQHSFNIFLIIKTVSSMAPNWDDQFDFDDLQPKKGAKKAKQQKKVKNNEDDFFDLQDDPPQKASKLPIITQKPKETSQSKIPIEKSNKNIKNTYDNYQEIDEQVQEVKTANKNQSKKAPQKNEFYEELEEQQKVKPVQVKKQPQKVVKKQEEEQEFYESLQDIKPQKQEVKVTPAAQKNYTQNNSQHQEVQSDYGEQNFDQYGEDFEEVEQKPKQPLPKKSQTTVNLKSKDKKQIEKPKTEEKKLVINTNKVFTNKQQKEKETKNIQPVIPKPPQKQNSNKLPSKKHIEPASEGKQKILQKSSSKKSLQSNDSRKHLSNSKVSTNKKTVQISLNRHIDMVEKQFPQSQQKVKEYSSDKVSRLNEQVRQMIRKFNEELNQLINKNMILLKDKPTQKVPNADDKVKVLEEQLKSGATAIQVAENEFDRLKGRQGELKEQQYQLMMQKKIEDTKQIIKQTTKQIVKLKFQVNNQGNKLSKHQVQKKLSQELHQIKMMLLQAKKEEEKNDIKLEKFEKMFEELQTKNSDKEYQLSQQIDNAKDKGIYLNVNSVTKKRYDELKLKVLATQNHKRCMQGLNKTKCDHLTYQNDQIRTNIKNTQSQINNLHQSIQHSQEESIAIIKKAKENTKTSQALSQNLDKILKSIQQNQAINFYEVRTQGNKSQASERPLKNSMYENMSKQKPPLRTNSSKKQPISASKQKPIQTLPASNDEINLMKPNFMKKKQKYESIHQQQKPNKLYERVWNEQQQRKKEQEKRKQQQRRKQQQKKRIEQENKKKKEAQLQQAIEEEKKKPFNLKRNRQNKQKSIEQSPQAKIEKKPEIQLPKQQKEQPKQQQKPSLGPKFMRLNKKDKINDVSKTEIPPQKPIVQQIKQIRKLPEQKLQTKASEQEQPAFVPKRFNLRNKIEKKEESYIPTLDKNTQLKEKKQEPKEIKKQYAPNFSFKQQEPFKAPIIEPKKPSQQEKITQVIEEKPRFNLRLRDRKKEGEAEYVPTKLIEPVAKTDTYNPFDRVIANKDQKIISVKKEEEKPYMPSFKPTIAQKQPEKPTKQQSNLNNPTLNLNNAYAPKPVNNPYAQAQKEEIVNPYAPKQDLPKRQKQGPLKKNKLLNKGPKEKINIYEQVQDITQPQVHIPISQPPKQQINLAKTDELDLNAMLGIKKKDKGNDLDDLLGEVKVQKKKQRKKNTDFFNDLEL